MDRQRRTRQTQDEAGFTVVELLIVSVLGIVVVMSAYQLLISQSRLLSAQGEMIDARDSSRGAAVLLASELRSAAASGNDLYVIAQDSVVVRSFQATAVMCAWDSVGTDHRIGLQKVSGTFPGTVADTASVYSFENDSWAAFDVTDAWNGTDAWGLGGTPFCFWGDSTATAPRPQATLQLAGPVAALATLGVGAPVRVFRRTKYGLFAQDGRWWLGRRVAAGAWELLTGPMLSPSNGGLTFAYYDANDVVTADPTLVSRVEFTLRSESYGQVSAVGQGGGTVGDSLTMTVFLRNNGAP